MGAWVCSVAALAGCGEASACAEVAQGGGEEEKARLAFDQQSRPRARLSSALAVQSPPPAGRAIGFLMRNCAIVWVQSAAGREQG
jgi:hypothetical protein